jgi:hypothetical protein
MAILQCSMHSLDRILSLLNPADTLILFISVRPVLIFSSHLRLRMPSNLGFRTLCPERTSVYFLPLVQEFLTFSRYGATFIHYLLAGRRVINEGCMLKCHWNLFKR